MPRPAKRVEADEGLDRPGFQGWDEKKESRLERPATRQSNPEALAAEARVVYLGPIRRHTKVLPGALIEMERADGSLFFVPAGKEAAQNLAYDFARIDARGRPNKLRLTIEDKRPFAICRHIAHLAWFYEQVDGPDGSPLYELRGPGDLLAKVKAYIEGRRRGIARDRENPINILSAMERAGANVFSDRGGDVGAPVV